MRFEHLKRLALRFGLSGMIFLVAALCAAGQSNTTNPRGSGTTFHGVPPSVTSFGFGGQPGFHGMPASVTSPNFGNRSFHVNLRVNHGPEFFQHRRRFGFRPGLRSPFLGDVVAVPYAYPVYVGDPGVDDSMETQEDYRGGPAIFDRRGPGAGDNRRDDYRTPDWHAREEQAEPQSDRDDQNADEHKQDTVADEVSTILVFKDGHQVEVRNYAIVGATLFDLSDGRTRKVSLRELDLSATVKQNDDRGVDFQVPVVARLN
jgi:hypothetical protein